MNSLPTSSPNEAIVKYYKPSELLGMFTSNGSELCMTIDNTHVTLEFASTVDIVNWCNAIKELAIEKLNDEC